MQSGNTHIHMHPHAASGQTNTGHRSHDCNGPINAITLIHWRRYVQRAHIRVVCYPHQTDRQTTKEGRERRGSLQRAGGTPHARPTFHISISSTVQLSSSARVPFPMGLISPRYLVPSNSLSTHCCTLRTSGDGAHLPKPIHSRPVAMHMLARGKSLASMTPVSVPATDTRCSLAGTSMRVGWS